MQPRPKHANLTILVNQSRANKDTTDTDLSFYTTPDIRTAMASARPRRSPTFHGNLREWLPSIGALVSLIAVILMSFSDISMAIASQSINTIQLSVLYSLGMFMTSVTFLLISSIKSANLLKRKYTTLEWGYLSLGAVVNGIGNIAFISAVRFIPVGDATSVLRTMPVFAAILGWIFLKQTIRIIDYPFILFCVTGVVFIARPSFIFTRQFASDNDGSLKLLGIAFALTSAFCFASMYTVGTKIMVYDVHPLIIMSFHCALQLSFICLVWLIFSRRWDCSMSHVTLLSILAGAIMTICQTMVYWSVSREKLVVVTVILASSVVWNNVLQIVIMRIIPHWLSGVGALLILTACVGMALRRAPPQTNTPVDRDIDDKSSF